MTTLSQMVDELIAETLKPDQKSNFVSWINQTVRELHVDDAGGSVGLSGNLVETVLIPDVDEAFVWDLPAPQRFQQIESVYYPNRGLYAKEKTPSSAYADVEAINSDVYFYRTGQGIAFSGYAGVGDTIKLAYFQYPRRLSYYGTAERPCAWSDANEAFAYLPAYDTNDSQRAAAQDLCTNWILFRYPDLVKQGVRQKLFARLGDEVRSRTSYSMYKTARPGFFSAETWSRQV